MVTHVAHSGAVIEYDDAGWCSVHKRCLGWYEVQAGGCFWCDPGLTPPTPRLIDANDKAKWEKRQKVWRNDN